MPPANPLPPTNKSVTTLTTAKVTIGAGRGHCEGSQTNSGQQGDEFTRRIVTAYPVDDYTRW